MDYARYMRLAFKERGRDFDGVDCWGLVRLVLLNEFGLRVPSYAASYIDSEDETAAHAIGMFCRDWTSLREDQVRPGDVIVFALLGTPTHCGVVIAPGMFMHIFRKRGVSCEEYGRPAWHCRIEGFYRWPT